MLMRDIHVKIDPSDRILGAIVATIRIKTEDGSVLQLSREYHEDHFRSLFSAIWRDLGEVIEVGVMEKERSAP